MAEASTRIALVRKRGTLQIIKDGLVIKTFTSAELRGIEASRDAFVGQMNQYELADSSPPSYPPHVYNAIGY